MLARFRKAVYPALATLIAVGGSWIATGSLDRAEIAVGVTGLVVSSSAFFTANVPGWPFAKALVGPVAANIAVLGTLIESGSLDRTALSALATSVVGAVVVYGLPNDNAASFGHPAA